MGGASFVGRVVSNRMQKTVVVAVDYVVWRPKLKLYEKRTHKHFAHDEQQECNIGDTVKILRTRKMSKHKSYKVANILRRVKVYSPDIGAAAVEQDLANKQQTTSRADMARQRYQLAHEQLEKLKRDYDQLTAATQLAAGSGSSNAMRSSSSSSSSPVDNSTTSS